MGLGADHGFAGSHDTGFFHCNGFAGITQPLLMIKIYTGDHRHIGINQINSVQTPAHANFKHHHIQPGIAENQKRRQRRKLKITQANVFTRLLNLLKR